MRANEFSILAYKQDINDGVSEICVCVIYFCRYPKKVYVCVYLSVSIYVICSWYLRLSPRSNVAEASDRWWYQLLSAF